MVKIRGETALVSKRNPKVFENRDFLPEHFSKLLKQMHRVSHQERLKKLGLNSVR